jgi:hypothetical protein
MPLQATSGAASYDGFGGGVAAVPQYIEEVFQTWLYTGNGSTQTITNGIDLSTKGGLVWLKERNNARSHFLQDSARTITSYLSSDNTDAASSGTAVTALNTTGFTLGSQGGTNGSANNYVSWSFRKQPKFFDVVTWTGSNDSGTNIGKGIVSHNLGSAPGCVIVKNTTSGSTNWIVYHRSLSGGYRVLLNTTDAQTNAGSVAYFSKYTDGVGWAQTNPDANNIYVGYNFQTNDAGATMVAYLFAHDAGGFGTAGTDNVISCGSFTTDASGKATVTLGYEPQFIIRKRSDAESNWDMADIMRRMDNTDFYRLRANLSNAEDTANGGPMLIPTATGFTVQTLGNTATHIYIAIRRGPMKVPTLGTSVFSPNYFPTGTSSPIVTNFPVDLQMYAYPPGTASINTVFVDRLRGVSTTTTTGGPRLITSGSAAESAAVSSLGWSNTGFSKSPSFGPSDAQLYLNFKRAPSFFDEVCYTGDTTARTLSHNLTVVPELMIVKNRTNNNGNQNWQVYVSALGNTSRLQLNTTDSVFTGTSIWNSTSPTASVFSLGTSALVNGSGDTYVAYLFATLAGVSKVGTYNGSSGTQTIDCGFAAGARFVLIKRTNSSGDWYVWDSARGMVSGTDPSLLLNSTAAEVNANSVYAITTGFQIVSTAAAINATGGTYIFLAIA